MSKQSLREVSNDYNFVKLIETAAKDSGYNAWQIWDDFIYMAAAELSQPLDFRQEREDEYIRRAKSKKNVVNSFPQIFAALVNTMEANNKIGLSDVLGDAYMRLELNNHWHGQFFTPDNVCKMMAKMTLHGDMITDAIEKKGFVTINDCACGAGGMLIAAADALRNYEINYQMDALYVGQDVDSVCALMCYIQLSLMGVPAIIQIANTLSMEIRDTWYTPFYMLYRWKFNKLWRRKPTPTTTPEAPDAPEDRTQKEESAPVPASPKAVADVEFQYTLDEESGQYSFF